MNIQENITKFTLLESNDSLSAFRGHAAQQSHNVYQIFYDFISEVKPSQILEIGTALGGFTEFLSIVCKDLNLNTKILSYDISERSWYREMVEKGIDVRVENIFNNSFTDVKNEVIDYVRQDGITIVLCDGGWKIGEFNIFSRYIKKGDFIMAHDYSFDIETFEQKIKNKIWNWCEITESDIKDTSELHNLIHYKQDVFDNCVWVCKTKK